jgi:methylenetetrahydrofolate--tRNA-(uracil-5-)-methyltransferase
VQNFAKTSKTCSITGGHLACEGDGPRSFQPMNVNFGLFPPLEAPSHDAEGHRIKGKERGVARKRALAARALATSTAGLHHRAASLQR